jgi:hypothetical protein
MLESRESDMWEWAYRPAASSRFADTAAVVRELRARGFEHLRQITDSKFAREQIDNMCRKASEAKSPASERQIGDRPGRGSDAPAKAEQVSLGPCQGRRRRR